jgi:hypothetical protein
MHGPRLCFDSLWSHWHTHTRSQGAQVACPYAGLHVAYYGAPQCACLCLLVALQQALVLTHTVLCHAVPCFGPPPSSHTHPTIRLGEEERKAAQAAKQQRDIEQKRANVGNTLSMLGIRHQGFSSMGKAPTRTGGAGHGAMEGGGREAWLKGFAHVAGSRVLRGSAPSYLFSSII